MYSEWLVSSLVVFVFSVWETSRWSNISSKNYNTFLATSTNKSTANLTHYCTLHSHFSLLSVNNSKKKKKKKEIKIKKKQFKCQLVKKSEGVYLLNEA